MQDANLDATDPSVSSTDPRTDAGIDDRIDDRDQGSTSSASGTFASAPSVPKPGVALVGALAFTSPEAQVQRTAELLGEGAIVVEVGAPPPSMRGRLAEHLDDLVERALGIRGAPSPYLSAWSAAMPDAAEARLSDQLFRSRTVGAAGIAIAVGSLARIAAPALTPEDSATLRLLSRVAESAALVVLIDDGDAMIGGYVEPIALATMLGHAYAEVLADEPAELVETRVDSKVAEIARIEVAVSEVRISVSTADAQADASAEAEAHALPRTELPAVSPVAPVAATGPVAARPVEARPSRDSGRDAARRRATAGIPVAGPSDAWRSWAIALGAARGPQPLTTFERLFIESYTPLANAIAAGLDDARALRAHEEFREGFERSYTDAFATFGATGRRPRLVMDAFDVAVKQARLHNARSTHVLVVDAMRYDLGCLVRDDLAGRAGGVASLTTESLLWSALPTTTFRQLETLARGMDALRAPAAEESSESLRGRSAETVRRLRVGSRELYKLDVVPSMLSGLGRDPALAGPAPIVAALADIATSVTDALLRHIDTLPPRTLLLVLGDHGFTIDKRGRITDGGASPEEVLVPCFSYLVGDLH